jgi:hypothetical protein
MMDELARVVSIAPKRNTGSVRRRRRSEARREAWRGVVSEWQRDSRQWEAAFGPSPDEPGCLCPRDILDEFGLGLS